MDEVIEMLDEPMALDSDAQGCTMHSSGRISRFAIRVEHQLLPYYRHTFIVSASGKEVLSHLFTAELLEYIVQQSNLYASQQMDPTKFQKLDTYRC